MRVILEVLSGPGAGRKTLLGTGQVLQVGRTEWADFTIPEDGHMSGVHFALETDEKACYIQDLGSSNGTLLNGQPLTEKAILRDADEIRAGETLFAIHVEGGAPDEISPTILTQGQAPEKTASPDSRRAADLAAAAGPSIVPAAPGATKVSYTVETCNSGLTLCRGTVDEVRPSDLATRISQTIPLYLIVDFKNLEGPPPEDLEQPDYLFDWLDPEAAAMVSPVLLSQNDSAAWPSLVEQGWGNDAVICLFSKQEKSTLLAHLRRSIRAKPHRDDLSGGIVGFCWPGVMGMLLAHNTPDFVRRLLAHIDAVLIELPDLPETWQVYGENPVAELLDRLGFARQLPEEAASRNSEDEA